MSDTGYFEQVLKQIRDDETLRGLGFRREDINYWSKGMNRNGVMQVTKPSWTVLTSTGQLALYEGVNVHFETEHPGRLNLHCELWPRHESESKADQEIIAPLLQIKGMITALLREMCLPQLRQFGADLKRTCREGAASPRSLKVMGFELELPDRHTASEFAETFRSVLATAAPMIDLILREGRWTDGKANRPAPTGPAMSGTVSSAEHCDSLPVNDQSILARVRAVRGLPERNMEDVVKRFLMLLGHPEDQIHFQVGRVDVRVQGPDPTPHMVLEVKRELVPMVLPGAVDQAFGYAQKVNSQLVVVTDADRYEVYDCGRGGDRVSMFAGRFQLTRYRRENDDVLNLLRPKMMACPHCRQATPGRSIYCGQCGQSIR